MAQIKKQTFRYFTASWTVCQGWTKGYHVPILRVRLSEWLPRQQTFESGYYANGYHDNKPLNLVTMRMVTMTTNLGLSRWRRAVVHRLRTECVSHPPTQSRAPSHSAHPSLPARLITKHSLVYEYSLHNKTITYTAKLMKIVYFEIRKRTHNNLELDTLKNYGKVHLIN